MTTLEVMGPGYGQIEISNLSFEERDKSFMKRIIMARFKIVRLEFRSPLHLGRGLGGNITAERPCILTLLSCFNICVCMLCPDKIIDFYEILQGEQCISLCR